MNKLIGQLKIRKGLCAEISGEIDLSEKVFL